MRVRRTGYNEAATRPRRDDFPNNSVGSLVKTDRGWVVAKAGVHIKAVADLLGHSSRGPRWMDGAECSDCEANHRCATYPEAVCHVELLAAVLRPSNCVSFGRADRI